ncbi:MAG: lytic transglycosylase domain-containing protein [Candidatus Nanopelagicales bacterium]
MSAQVLSVFLRAVALVESADNAHAVGAAGERGRFQITPAVAAVCGGYGDPSAVRWERQLERELLAAGIDPLPFNVALAWNAGPGAVKRGTVPESSYDYARRVVATMERLEAVR